MIIDANQQIIPLAFAIVDEETKVAWRWFLRLLSKHIVRGMWGVCLISDRHIAIIKAVESVPAFQEPLGVHRFCLRHIASNFNSRFKCVELKDLCYNAGRAFTVFKFNQIMEQIKELSPATFAYLDSIDRAKWTFCYDQGFRCGIMTTNMFECFNGVLVGARRLPITVIVRITFQRTKNFFMEREKLAIKFQWTNQRFLDNILNLYQKEAEEGVTSRYTVDSYNNALQIASVSTFYDGSKTSHTYTVKLSTRECSCGKWSFTGISCSHAAAVCRHFHFEVSELVHVVYSTQTYASIYSSALFLPLGDEEEWGEASFMLTHDPERRIKHRGRDVTIESTTRWIGRKLARGNIINAIGVGVQIRDLHPDVDDLTVLYALYAHNLFFVTVLYAHDLFL
ncbi:hypothetical protein ACS0TY_032595 [Phlomoides rotata]